MTTLEYTPTPIPNQIPQQQRDSSYLLQDTREVTTRGALSGGNGKRCLVLSYLDGLSCPNELKRNKQNKKTKLSGRQLRLARSNMRSYACEGGLSSGMLSLPNRSYLR
jgi:hypothetical protein